MPEVDLELYRHITVSGDDAVEFLQGQLTQDVGLLRDAQTLFAAWCNPKGRVITTLRLLTDGDAIGLCVPADIIDSVLRRLMMYRLRSKVEFEEDNPRWLNQVDAADTDPTQLIHAGIPTIDSTNTEKYTPHMLNLDKLAAVSFSKGCYTGQEVVARTENLGKVKRRLMHYTTSKSAVEIGSKLTHDGTHVGEVVNFSAGELLAVLPIALHTESVSIDADIAEPVALPYAF